MKTRRLVISSLLLGLTKASATRPTPPTAFASVVPSIHNNLHRHREHLQLESDVRSCWLRNDHAGESRQSTIGQERNGDNKDHCASVISRRFIFNTAGGISAAALALSLVNGPTTQAIAAYDDDDDDDDDEDDNVFLGRKLPVLDDNVQVTEDADPSVLLRRLQEVDRQLDQILSLVDRRQWSQISQLVSSTGPLGQPLTRTLEQIVAAIPNDTTRNKNNAKLSSMVQVQRATKKLQDDVHAIREDALANTISGGSNNVERCRAETEQAIQDLEAVVQVAFCRTNTMVCFDASSTNSDFQEQQEERQQSMDSLTEKLLGNKS